MKIKGFRLESLLWNTLPYRPRFQRKFILALLAVNLAMLAGIDGNDWQIIGLSRRYFEWDGAFLGRNPANRRLGWRYPSGRWSIACRSAWHGVARRAGDGLELPTWRSDTVALSLEAILQALLLISLADCAGTPRPAHLAARRKGRGEPRSIPVQFATPVSVDDVCRRNLGPSEVDRGDRMMPQRCWTRMMWFLFDLFVPTLLSLPAFVGGAACPRRQAVESSRDGDRCLCRQCRAFPFVGHSRVRCMIHACVRI